MTFSVLAVVEAVAVLAAAYWRFRRRGAAPEWPRTGPERARAAEFGLLAVLTALAPAAVAFAPVPARIVPGVAALLLAPGAALLTFQPVRDTLDRLLLAVVLSGTILVLASMVMLWAGAWSPQLLVHLSAVTAAPVLALRAVDAVTASGVPSRTAPGAGVA